MQDKFCYRAVCFDLFHTLVDVAAAPGSSGHYTADILGVAREAWSAACFGELHEITRPTEHLDVVRTLAHSLDPSIPEEFIVTATTERQRRFDHALRCVESEVIDTLVALRRRGLRLALVSNASSGEVAAWPQSPLAPLFDAVVFSWECGWRKPQREIYREALTRLGVAAAESLFVGDGGSDELRGAHGVGMTPVLISRHLRGLSPERLAQRQRDAQRQIVRLSELLDGWL